jgi:hypothetical protein
MVVSPMSQPVSLYSPRIVDPSDYGSKLIGLIIELLDINAVVGGDPLAVDNRSSSYLKILVKKEHRSVHSKV